MTSLILINPNTNAETTGVMGRIARRHAGPGVTITCLTAKSGSPLITNEAQLATAADAVLALREELTFCAGVIVSAFGDPGLMALRARITAPVTGIAEAAMMAASAGGRPFAVATTTPDLMAAIERTARAYGHHDAFLGVCVPKQARNNPTELMRDPERLVAALREACADAMELGAAAIIIGGGPLAEAAISLQGIVAVPIIQPIPAAVALALDRAAAMQPARDG